MLPKGPTSCFIAESKGIGKPLSLANCANSFCSLPVVPNNFLPSLPIGPNIKGVKAAAPAFQYNAFFIATPALVKVFLSTSPGGISDKSSPNADAICVPAVSFNKS